MRADISNHDSSNWVKKPVTKQQIEPLCNKFNISPLLASIFVRRGITEGADLLYYLEDDLRFQHNPFLLSGMEDAVERILQAKEEGEKVLIFGDSDVDGVSSTAILYEELVRLGIDVQWRLPLDDDGWEDVPTAQLTVYKKGEKIFSGTKHDGIFVPTLQYITSNDAMNI